MLPLSIYRSIFDSAPVSEYLLSPTPEAIILAVNDAFLRTASRTREELLGKSVFEAFPENPDDPQDTGVAALRKSLLRVIASGKPDTLATQRYPIWITMPDGAEKYEERYWSATNTPVFDAEGKLACISHRTIDITEKRNTEEALRRSAARQAFRLDLADRLRPLTSPEEIVATACEILGRHLSVSRVLYAEVDDTNSTFIVRRDWTGRGQQSIAGEVRRLDDFGPEIVALLRAGNPMLVDDVRLDPRTAAYADAYDKINVRANLALSLVKSGTMTIILALHQSEPRHWTSHDIELAREMAERTWSAVENASAQADLLAERDQSRYILDSMKEGFALIGPDWRVLQMNAEGLRIVQRTAQEIIGRNHWEVFPESVGTTVDAVCRRVMATRIADNTEYEYPLPAGGRASIEVRAHPLLNEGLAIFFRDITERKRTEHELREASRRKDEFLAMLAHELRNPLAPISAAAELMAMTRLDEARLKQTSEVISRQVGHMTGLIDDLLDVSRVTRGLATINETPQDLKSIVSNAVEQVHPIMEAQRHHLAIDLSPEAAHVRGDSKRLVQILTNLLNNAAKYTPAGGEIHLRMEVHEDKVSLHVQDNGIGIAPELQARVFELFTQAERSADRSQGGLGLGLALVKSLVELHKGTVTCSSEGPGKGSCFTVCLPRLKGQSGEVDRRQGRNALHQSADKLQILVVDDNVDAAQMLKMLLEEAGHEVAVEHDPYCALERARIEAPDVGVLDIGLPDMDGNELARRLRAQPETAHATLIAVTGYGHEHDRRNAIAAGFNHHFVKPVDAARLTSVLRQVRAH